MLLAAGRYRCCCCWAAAARARGAVARHAAPPAPSAACGANNGRDRLRRRHLHHHQQQQQQQQLLQHYTTAAGVRAAAAASPSPPPPPPPGMPATADELRGQSCSLLGGCSSDTPKLTQEQVAALLAELPAWQLRDDGASIVRAFTAKNFMAAVRFFNAAAEVAEADGHHPDLHLTNYRDVEVVLSTHAAGGLTQFDAIMAAKLDAAPVELSPKWAKANPRAVTAGAAAAAAAAGAAKAAGVAGSSMG